MIGLQVLMVSEFPPRHGGVSDYTADLTGSLSLEGVSVSVLTFPDSGAPVKERLPYGTTVYRSLSPGLFSGTSSIRLARELEPDLVHLQLTTFLFDRGFYVFPLLHSSTPLLVTVHDAPRSYRAFHMIPFVRVALKRSRRIICLSNHVRDLLVSFHRIEPASIARIPLGVDLRRYNPTHRTPETRRRLGWEGKFVVLMAGFLNPGKGVHTLLQAAALTEIPDLQVVIAGEFTGSSAPSLDRGSMDTYEDFIRAEIVRLGLSDLVDLRGYVPAHELPLLLANSDVFVLPYAYSYQSIILDYAMASGCSVIASDIAAFREFVANHETGLLANANDARDWATKLQWVHDNPNGAKRLGPAARQLAERRLDLGVTAEMHQAIYQEELHRTERSE